MSRPRKPPDRLVDRRPERLKARLATVTPIPVKVPPSPPGLLKRTQEAWEQFFASDPASIVSELDYPSLERLFRYYDEWTRASRTIRSHGRLVQGSKGQPVLNPLAEWTLKLESAIQRLEDRFGITPLSRSRLGISFGQAALTLEDLNRQVSSASDEPDDEVLELLNREDPHDDRGSAEMPASTREEGNGGAE